MKEMGAAHARCVCVGQNANDENMGSVYLALNGEKDPLRISMALNIASKFIVGDNYRLVIQTLSELPHEMVRD